MQFRVVAVPTTNAIVLPGPAGIQGPAGVPGTGFTPIDSGTLLGNGLGVSSLPQALEPPAVRTLLNISNVDNTSDLNKPLSNAMIASLASKLNTSGGVVSGLLSFSGLDSVGLRLKSLTSSQYGNLTPGDGDLYLDTTTNRIDARVGGTTREVLDNFGGQQINGALSISGTILPVVNNTQHIGSPTAYFNRLHVDRIITPGLMTLNASGTGYGGIVTGTNGFWDADNFTIRSAFGVNRATFSSTGVDVSGNALAQAFYIRSGGAGVYGFLNGTNLHSPSNGTMRIRDISNNLGTLDIANITASGTVATIATTINQASTTGLNPDVDDTANRPFRLQDGGTTWGYMAKWGANTRFQIGDFRVTGNACQINSASGTQPITVHGLRVGSSNNDTLLTVDRTSGNVVSSPLASTLSSGIASAITINPTLNQTGTAGSTGLLINRTETAMGSGLQSFIDCQVGGSSRVRIANSGAITTVGTINATNVIEVGASPASTSITLRHDLNYLGLNADKRIVWSNVTGTGNFFSGTNGLSLARVNATTAAFYTTATGTTPADLSIGSLVWSDVRIPRATKTFSTECFESSLSAWQETSRQEASPTGARWSVMGATPIVRQTHAAVATDLATAITRLNTLCTHLTNFGLFN